MTHSRSQRPRAPFNTDRAGERLLFAPPLLLLAEGGQHSSSVLLWLVVPLLLGAVVLSLLALRAHRRDRARLLARHSQAKRHIAVRPTVSSIAAKSSGEAGAVVTMVALDLGGKPSTPQLPLPVLPPTGVKVCRTCGREFRTALAKCPFDQTKLSAKAEPSRGRPRDDYLDTRRSLMRCERCERVFDLDAKYCPFDGETLESVEEEDTRAHHAGLMICHECGEAFDEDAYFCPDDGSRLFPAEPSAGHMAFGALPLVICPDCQREFPWTMATCPDDGHELLTLVGRKTGGFPRHGLGPREQICPKCSERYGDDVRFCALDGAELLPMN